MRATRIMMASLLAGSIAAPASPAAAHLSDLMSAKRAGPIVRSNTTMAELKDWFGDPTVREVVPVGCVQVIKAKWGKKLMVYAWRDEGHPVAATFVRKRTITSSEHGDLTMHTHKDLRVGDRERRLRNLYPGAEPMTHDGHTHYRIGGEAPDGGYMLAKVVDDEVVQLENWPFEFC